MSYIEREKALEFVLNNTPHINGETTMKCVERAIKAIPTADVVEVVRCKDCFYSEKTLSDECPKECSWCRKLCFVTHENHYCSYGERREE